MTAAEEFLAWWQKYPSKVGKLAALPAFTKARKLATFEELMSGVDRYIVNKPDYAEWAHPKTWLNQGRWMDEPRTTERRVASRIGSDERRISPKGIVSPCPHVPPCEKTWDCGMKQLAEMRA